VNEAVADDEVRAAEISLPEVIAFDAVVVPIPVPVVSASVEKMKSPVPFGETVKSSLVPVVISVAAVVVIDEEKVLAPLKV
jgi:hypothetical protein